MTRGGKEERRGERKEREEKRQEEKTTETSERPGVGRSIFALDLGHA